MKGILGNIWFFFFFDFLVSNIVYFRGIDAPGCIKVAVTFDNS